jgi:PAS domain S-box-containing protein
MKNKHSDPSISELEKRLVQLETIFDTISDPIWLLDTDFRISLINRSAEKLFDLPSCSIIGRHCWEIVHQTSEPHPNCPVLEAMKTKKRAVTEFAFKDRCFEVTVDPVLDSGGHITAFTHIISEITLKKQTEETVRTRENHLRAILESSLESVFLMDTEGRLLYANQVTANRLKKDMETLMKGNMFDVLPEDVAANRKKHILQVIESGLPVQFEDERFERTILNSIYPVFGDQGRVTHLAVYGVDITERKKLENHIGENEERYRNLFINNHAVLLVIDPESGRIVDANPAACHYYGYLPDTLKTLRIMDINTLNPEEIFEEMARARAESRNYFNFRHRLASGETRDVEVYSGPIVNKGRQYLFSIIHDISDRRKAEAEKERLIRELSDAFLKIKVLKGLIPICASCKKIRDDQGFWQQIESYIRDHSEAEFSHGICPDCKKKLYPLF